LQAEARAVLARDELLGSDLRRVVGEIWGRREAARRDRDSSGEPAAR
jgi:hypothetical protein